MRLLAARCCLQRWPLRRRLPRTAPRSPPPSMRWIAAYAALLGKLTRAAKLHLERDQERWLANRRACDANAGREGRLPGVPLPNARRQAQAVRRWAVSLHQRAGHRQIRQAGARDLRHRCQLSAVRLAMRPISRPSTEASPTRRADTVDDVVQSEFNVGYDQTFDLFRLNRDVVSVWVHSEMSAG